MREEVFAAVLRMSLIGSYCTLVALLARLFFLKVLKAPRKYAYYLWLIVFVNFCIPFSIPGPVSLIPERVQELSLEADPVEVFGIPVPSGVEDVQDGADGNGSGVEDRAVSGEESETDGGIFSEKEGAGGALSAVEPELPGAALQQASGVEKIRIQGAVQPILSCIWLAGFCFFLIFQALGILRVGRLLSDSPCVKKSSRRRVRVLQGLPAPFLWGLLRPTIYLPANLDADERHYILAHEEYHRRRKDPLVKCLILLICGVHWFNPFAWLAYVLCCRDMEISCDEAVISGTDGDIRKAYASSLLKYAAKQNGYFFVPLTFGEPSVKSRIQNVLRYRKKSLFVSVIALALVLAAAAGLILRPSGDTRENGETVMQDQMENGQTSPAEGEAGEEASAAVVNNGGSVIQVNGKLYYTDGSRFSLQDGSWEAANYTNSQSLYSDGKRLYLSNTGADGIYIYWYALDGNSFARLTEGTIVDCSGDGSVLYYTKNAEDAGQETDGSALELWRYDTESEESRLLHTGFFAYLGQFDGAFYTARRQDEEMYIEEIREGDGSVDVNPDVLGGPLSREDYGAAVETIPAFYADAERIILSAGAYQGTMNNFSGKFYSFDRASGTLTQKQLTAHDSFAVMDGYVYYPEYFPEYSSAGTGGKALMRAGTDLETTERIGENMDFVGTDEARGCVLAVRGSGRTYQSEAEEISEGRWDLVSMLPDGSRETVLVDEDVSLGWSGQMAEGDKIQYTEANILGSVLYVKARQLGYRGQAGWRDEVLQETWLRVDLNGGGCEIWEPQMPEKEPVEPLLGMPVDPAENGWDLTSPMDLTAPTASADGNLHLDTYSSLLAGSGEETCMVDRTEHYVLYGKSDFASLLFSDGESYAQLDYPWLSNYLILPRLLEGDFDGDGRTELAVILQVKHGTGIYIDTFLMADAAEDGSLFVYEFAQEDFTAQLFSYLTHEQTETGTRILFDGEVVWETIENMEETVSVTASVGSQIRFSFEDGQIILTAELELWHDDPNWATPEFTGKHIQAQVAYQDGGGFSLSLQN